VTTAGRNGSTRREPTRSLLERLDRRLAALLLEAERGLDGDDLMTFAQKLADRKEAFWEKHVYPRFRERIARRIRTL
jgi:hypothetical protein